MSRHRSLMRYLRNTKKYLCSCYPESQIIQIELMSARNVIQFLTTTYY